MMVFLCFVGLWGFLLLALKIIFSFHLHIFNVVYMYPYINAFKAWVYFSSNVKLVGSRWNVITMLLWYPRYLLF